MASEETKQKQSEIAQKRLGGFLTRDINIFSSRLGRISLLVGVLASGYLLGNLSGYGDGLKQGGAHVISNLNQPSYSDLECVSVELPYTLAKRDYCFLSHNRVVVNPFMTPWGGLLSLVDQNIAEETALAEAIGRKAAPDFIQMGYELSKSIHDQVQGLKQLEKKVLSHQFDPIFIDHKYPDAEKGQDRPNLRSQLVWLRNFNNQLQGYIGQGHVKDAAVLEQAQQVNFLTGYANDYERKMRLMMPKVSIHFKYDKALAKKMGWVDMSREEKLKLLKDQGKQEKKPTQVRYKASGFNM